MKSDTAGRTYLEFNERCTKICNGTSRDERRFSPKMFETGELMTGDMHSNYFYLSETNKITIYNRLFLE